jgi:hypothetical protein
MGTKMKFSRFILGMLFMLTCLLFLKLWPRVQLLDYPLFLGLAVEWDQLSPVLLIPLLPLNMVFLCCKDVYSSLPWGSQQKVK